MYAYPTGYIIMLSLVTANTAGYTKKVTVNAMILIGYCVGKLVYFSSFSLR